MSKDELLSQNQKHNELYKASLEAFFLNELEHDKIILGLATAGIGFFIAIFLKSILISEIMFITSIGALIFFSTTVFIILTIFVLNKKQLLLIIENGGEGGEIKVLPLLDNTKYIPFALAILMSVIFTLSIIYQSFHNKEKNMSDDKQIIIEKIVISNDGFSEIASANSRLVTEGFSGISTANKVERGFSGVASANQGETNSSANQGETNSSANQGETNSSANQGETNK